MKTVTCQKAVPVSDSGFESDVRRIQFRFAVVETSLIGSPEEKSETQICALIVCITWELRVNWRLQDAPHNDLVKILYEFGKRHLIKSLETGHLQESDTLLLTTENAPDQCPFEASRIAEPEGATFQVDTVSRNMPRPAFSTTDAVEQRQRRCRLALTGIYQSANGSRNQPVTLETVAQAAGWSGQETDEVYSSLIKDGLIEHFSVGGYIIRMTHSGLVTAESYLENDIVQRRRAGRMRVLEKIYKETQQHGPIQIDLEPLARAEGIEGRELSNLYEYLTGEGFIRPRGAGYYIIMMPEDKLRVQAIMSDSTVIEVFFCYSHEDEKLRNELEKHLQMMKREGIIAGWHDRKISAGQEWEGQISENLNRARLILLLVSVDFINSEYCWNVEMKRAMAKHEAGTARVVPIILRPCDWHGAPFGKLQALPTDGRPVVDHNWHSTDEAFLDVAKGIRKAVEELRSGLTPLNPPN